jgi:outer membrane protein
VVRIMSLSRSSLFRRPSAGTRPTPGRLRRPTMARAIALALAGLGLGSVQAQSLQPLYEAARDHDATLESARLQTDGTRLKAAQSRALKGPSVDGGASLAASTADTPWSSTRTTHNQQGQLTLTARQSLYNRANDATIAQSERGVAVAESQLRAAQQDLMLRLTQAYFDVLTAQDALATVRANRSAIAEQLASAKRNFEVGTATITDTREAEARADLVRAQEIAAENDLETTGLALGQLVGRDGLQPRPLARPVTLPALLPDDVEAWVAQAEANNAQLAQLRLALDVARLETDKARAALSPTVSASATLADTWTRVSGRTVSSGQEVPFGPNRGSGLSGSVGVALNMPLYSGESLQNRLKETLALEAKARADLEAARRSVAQGTRSAFQSLRSLRARIGALQAAEASSALALQATQLGYQVGVRVNLDVLNAQSQLNGAQRDLAKARYDLLVGQLKLRQLAGVLAEPDLQATDALLAR